jgi:endonuclease G
MTAPQNQYAFDLEVALAASSRWKLRGEHHDKFENAIKKQHYSELDTPARCAARANRLLDRLRRSDPDAVNAMADEFGESAFEAISRAELTSETVTDELLERVIGTTRDFQFVEFLEAALFASKSVGRIVTKLSGGRVAYGSGFMVSPSLMITNHHVLPSEEIASLSMVEFDYQRDRLGRMLTVSSFRLDPSIFFLNDLSLDFALVAVSPAGSSKPLDNYGWCPLIPTLGKIITGEPINIVQHPKGDLKQIVIRENLLLDTFEGTENFLHYEADTEPGSSGSPVFNDQWEVVALHHSGVPRKNSKGALLSKDGTVWKKGDDPSRLDWVANEGVRVSKIVEFVSSAEVNGAEQKSLLEEFLNQSRPGTNGRRPSEELPDSSNKRAETAKAIPSMTKQGTETHEVSLTIPLNITISLGDLVTSDAASVPHGISKKKASVENEGVEIDPDYGRRPGYDPDFLGFNVPFPRLTAVTRSQAYDLEGVSGEERYILKYYHYSLIFNQSRKLAFVAGVNYDPNAPVQYKREKDRWFYDPRVTPETELQAGEKLYEDNPLDRGHLVRRADAGWGQTEAEAKLANDDTFHFTNCSPQHSITNQGKTSFKDRGRVIVAPPGLKLWGKLEDYVASQGKTEGRKLSIFNGPIFRESDLVYRGIQVPQEFWKLVVFPTDSGEPGAAAFVLSQAELIEDLKEDFRTDEYKTVQITISELESRTKLNFGRIGEWDVLEQEGASESFTRGIPAVILDSLTDMVLSKATL